MKKMNYPADYAVLSNEEMTYTTGGGAVDDAASLATTAATVVGAVVLASSYIWGIKQARTWLQQDGNKDGNFFTVMGRATDALAADMGKSAGNFVRDAVSTIMVFHINRNIVFDWINVKHLRCIGWSMVGICVLSYISVWISSHQLAQSIELAGGELNILITFSDSTLILGFVALLASEVFAIGLRLKEENELTI